MEITKELYRNEKYLLENDIMETLDSRLHGNDKMIYIIDKNAGFPFSRE